MKTSSSVPALDTQVGEARGVIGLGVEQLRQHHLGIPRDEADVLSPVTSTVSTPVSARSSDGIWHPAC